MKRSCLSVLAVAALFVFVGCAQKPQKEIDAANGSMERAKAAEASVYASEQLLAAQASLDAAFAEIAKQDKAFALGRSYATAVTLLQKASTDAEAAAAASASNKAQAKVEADSLATAAQTLIADVRKLADEAVKAGKGADSLKAQLDTAAQSLAAAQSAGDLMAIKANASQVIATVGTVRTAIEALAAGAKKKK